MAYRYIVATGNWNSTSTWSATSGGASGASVPTSSDSVTINSNYSVTLTADANCSAINHSNGTLNLSSYTLNVVSFNSTGSTARTINMGSGKIIFNNVPDFTFWNITGSNLTLNSGTSQIICNINGSGGPSTFSAGSYTYSDVRFNMGLSSNSATLNITGAPTFSLLDIRSANSAAHTVNFEGVRVDLTRLVAIGASSANKLKLASVEPSNPVYPMTKLYFAYGGSSYGQFVDVGSGGTEFVRPEFASGASNIPFYIGSNSVQHAADTYGEEWLLEDPPKIDTLVDEFATLNTTTWETTTTGSGSISVSSNELIMSWFGGSSSYVSLKSKGTFDFIDSTFYMKVPHNNLGLYLQIGDLGVSTEVTTSERYYKATATTGGVLTISKFITSWTTIATTTVDPELLRAMRVQLSGSRNMTDGSMVIDSVGVSNNSVPTVTTTAASSVSHTTATTGGNVTSDGNTAITERGVVYSTSPTPTTASSKLVASGTTGSFTSNLTGLNQAKTYYVRAYAINSVGTSYGSEISFTTTTSLSVATGTLGSPGLSTVLISNNSITNPDSLTLTEYGVVYGTTTSPTTADNKLTSASSQSSYNSALTGLSESTTYYARAYAIFDGAPYYGSQVTFTTSGRPVITINAPITSTTDIRPKLEFTGTDSDSNRIQYQLQFNTSDSFTSPLIDVTTGVDSGFSNLDTPADTSPYLPANKIRYTLASDYTRGTTYYWRVRGKDPAGSNSWGEWTASSSFLISPIPATVTISGVSNIDDTSLDVNANIDSDGGATVTERGVCWSLSANPTTADDKATGTGNPYTVTATPLTASTTYNFRAYAINSAGTSYSANISQQTLQPEQEPTLTTADASNISYTSATLGGEVTLNGRHSVTERGVVFSENPAPTTLDRKYTAPTVGLGSYSGGVTGLDPDVLYYVRSYAINSQGTGYGDEKTFTTLALPADEDDGYWVFSNTESTAVVARTQATPPNSSANIYIEPFLTVGETYTVHVGAIASDYGTPKLVLEYIDGTLQSFEIAQNTGHTFTYSGTTSLVRLRLYVTAATTVTEELTATFADLYMAKEASFSSFVNFERQGSKEIKIINNQIVDKRREDVLPSIYSQLLGLRYTPFEITTEGLGYFEIYDGFTITDPNNEEITVLMTDKSLTLDGGIQEKLQGKTPDKTETDYSKAGGITKLLSQTTLTVDKQKGEIESLVSDVYDNDGYVEDKFSQVYQDIEQVKTTVQGAGGVNLVRNSSMYAYNNLGYPESWTTTVGSTGTITIQGNPESRNAGGISGNSFTLSDATVKQTVTVRKDVDFVAQELKTYYAFNAKVKKNLVGVAHIKLSNRNETHQIDLETGTEYYWDDITFESLLPLDDHYEIEIYSDEDAELQVTDIILSVGEFRHEWTQAAGELGNASVSITEDGLTIRQDQFRYNYLHMNALGLEVHQKVIGQDYEIFGFNGAETNTYQLKTEKQFTMGDTRVLPIDDGLGLVGWAFAPKKENT